MLNVLLVGVVGASMYSWLAGRRLRRDARSALAATRTMARDDRIAVATQVLLQIAAVHSGREADGAIGALRAAETALEQASDGRRAATERGEETAGKLTWIANALIERWSSALILVLTSRQSLRDFCVVDEEVWAFISETFEPELATLGASLLSHVQLTNPPPDGHLRASPMLASHGAPLKLQ